ncbi:hypothetical protein J6590_011375 [Homalodisca vitripennis]|nr:hypothetical protein J6590_011375 [Homalodisca vitripennis]
MDEWGLWKLKMCACHRPEESGKLKCVFSWGGLAVDPSTKKARGRSQTVAKAEEEEEIDEGQSAILDPKGAI